VKGGFGELFSPVFWGVVSDEAWLLRLIFRRANKSFFVFHAQKPGGVSCLRIVLPKARHRLGKGPARAGEDLARAGEGPARAGEDLARAGEDLARAGEDLARAERRPGEG
jgi:hypothetical protein